MSNHLVRSPIKVNMINMVGTIGTELNLDELFKTLHCDETINGITLEEKEKGQVKRKKVASFYNCMTIYLKSESNRILKVKLFCSGAVHIPGCLFLKDGTEALKLIYQKLKSIDNFKPIGKRELLRPQICEEKTMYTTQYQLNLDYINRLALAKIIRDKYKTYCIYRPEKYPGLKIYYDTKTSYRPKVSIIIHRSGRASINGANTKSKIIQAYNFINKIISDNLDLIK